MNDCPLCKADKLTHWYYEDDIFWIADCKECKVPMVVIRAHRRPIQDELELMIKKVHELFDMKTNVLDFNNRKILKHFHFHVRKFKK